MNDHFWPFSADHGLKVCLSNPVQSVVSTMQMTGQVECIGMGKWSAISQQLNSADPWRFILGPPEGQHT
ncbi:hypothetical protein D3C81_321840 [compost metagenome]